MNVHRLALAFLLTAAAFGQGDRGTLTGTVADPHNALIPAAQVAVRNPETGAQYASITPSTGNYSLAQLPAGSYDVSVEAPGFKKYTQRGVTVGVAQTVRIDVVMEIGS